MTIIEAIIESKCMSCCDYTSESPHWTATIYNDNIDIQEHEINFRHKLLANNYNISRDNGFHEIKNLLEKSNKYARDTEDLYCSTNTLFIIIQIYQNNNLMYRYKWYNEPDEEILFINQKNLLVELENFLN